VILFLLAITSNTYSIRKLGRRWQKLHYLAYAAGVRRVIHFWWLVKADITLPRRWVVTSRSCSPSALCGGDAERWTVSRKETLLQS
jgi:hypothetical protein